MDDTPGGDGKRYGVREELSGRGWQMSAMGVLQPSAGAGSGVTAWLLGTNSPSQLSCTGQRKASLPNFAEMECNIPHAKSKDDHGQLHTCGSCAGTTCWLFDSSCA